MSKTEKRKAGGKSPAQRKKQKTANQDESKPSSERVMVRGDALKWRAVALPSRMEDAEGFYGLEEIDDVDVVLDVKQQHVMFQPKYDQALAGNANDGYDDSWNEFEDRSSEPAEAKQNVASNASTDMEKSASSRQATSAKSEPKEALLSNVRFEGLPSTVRESKTDTSAWEELDLSPTTLSQLAQMGFSKPTPIQKATISPILEGHDLIGKAVTGSGKTLAFGIPIFEHWLQNRIVAYKGPAIVKNSVLALVLAPTRELALQLNRHLNELCIGLDEKPRIVAVTGGLSIYKQQRQLETADIVIATPGRLWEVMNETSANRDTDALVDRLKQIKFLVVDEADRLLSEGHFKEFEDILGLLDREVVAEEGNDELIAESGPGLRSTQRQTLVFSATFHKGLQRKLTAKSKPGNRSLNDLLDNKQSMEYLLQKLSFREEKPVFVDANPTFQMAEALSESIVECAAMKKDLYLYTLLVQNLSLKTLVFTNSISAVKRLTAMLQNLDQPAVGLHSTMPQKSRLRSLERFSGDRKILVATDVAARGLDIKGIELVIHYHVPRTADTYVHRSGRTARANNSGRSILLCSPDEVAGVKRLIIEVHKGANTPDVLEVERHLVGRLEPRVILAQKITDATQAREKLASKDEWLRTAAEELGADYDSDEFENQGQKNKRGRGGGKAKKQQERAAIDKEQMVKWRVELKEMLAKRVNLGVSERYLAGGRVDVDALLDGKAGGTFLERR